MDASVSNSGRSSSQHATDDRDSRWMSVRRSYWAARRHLIQRDVVSFIHTGQNDPHFPQPIGVTIDISGDCATGRAIVDAIVRQSGLTRDIIQARFAAGHRIVHATAADGRLLAWGWIVLSSHPIGLQWESDLRIQIDPGVGYLFDFETMPAARNRGLYRLLLDRAVKSCYANGATLVGIYCRADNVASRRAILAAGFVNPLAVSVLRLGPWFRVRAAGRSRWGLFSSALPLTDMLRH